jgi:hypothetical protein
MAFWQNGYRTKNKRFAFCVNSRNFLFGVWLEDEWIGFQFAWFSMTIWLPPRDQEDSSIK